MNMMLKCSGWICTLLLIGYPLSSHQFFLVHDHEKTFHLLMSVSVSSFSMLRFSLYRISHPWYRCYFSLAVIKHHEKGNSYKELYVWHLQFHRGKSTSSSWQESCIQRNKQGTGAAAGNSHLNPHTGSIKRALKMLSAF